MNRSVDSARSFLEQPEARGGYKAAVLDGEFSDIRACSASWKTEGVCSTEGASQVGNMKKNRYKDVLPYDQTRVILSLLEEEGHSDYINGNFIQVILMACREMEQGRKKCERYWTQEQEQLKNGLFCIILKSCSVYQLQFISWPDHGVPRNPDHILTMTIPPNFSLFDVVLEMRKQRPQRPSAIQTEEQYRFVYYTVAQMFCSALQSASPHYEKLKENCSPLYDDALSLRTSQALPAIPRLLGGVFRSISVPRAPALAMADTYAVVQKCGAPEVARPEASGRRVEEAPLYTQVTPRALRPGADTAGVATRAEDARRALTGHARAIQSPVWPGAYEDVANGVQTSGLGFNLRIGRPKGPRDPPAEWTRV